MNIFFILIFALLIKCVLYTSYPPFWDAASYILMGKYLFSSATAGLIEAFRPPVWPLCLGLFWKIGLDPIAAGRILEIFLGLGNILLTYLIGKKVYGKNIGLLAALFVAFSPTFFLWGNSLYADVPASFLGLLAVYMFLEERFFWAGILGALSFFTRMAQIFPILALIATHMAFRNPKQSLKELKKFVLAFLIVVSMFLIFNHVLYGSWAYPFAQAKEVYVQPYIAWTTGIFQCLKVLVKEENWLFPLLIVSLITLFKGGYRCVHWAIALAALGSLLIIGKSATDYHRLSLSSLPYLYLLLAQSLCLIKERLGNKTPTRVGFIAVLVIVFAFQFNTLIHMRFPKNELNVFQKYIAAHEKNFKGNLWISSPKMLVFSNLTPKEQMYHPIFSYHRAQELRSKLSTADLILLNTYDLPCVPKNDSQCETEKARLVKDIKQKFEREYYEEDPKGGYVLGIFTSRAQNQ